jgi:aspartyl-tRNA(Asn)/glutamyl-tRNA(Gln) amidotransferase subunit A
MDAVPGDFLAMLAACADTQPVGLLAPAMGKADAREEGRQREYLDMDLTVIAACLRAGEISSVALTQQALERLQAIAPQTNACVVIEADAALTQAQRCDAALRDGGFIGPLHGVPMAHKDLFYRRDVPACCGMAPRTARPYAFDGSADVLNRMEDAGAVNMARLHMTEFAFEPSGSNSELGPCRNPWNIDRVTGGSSSGSAVVVAARAAYAALGSDTGGSVRIPASLCGVTGLKPTWGLVSTRGAMPLSHTNDTIGPLARSAADCALLMQVIAGAPVGAGAIPAHMLSDFAAVAGGAVADIQGLRIGVPQAFFRDGLDPQIGELLDRSLATLEAMGARLCAVPEIDWMVINTLGAMVTRVEASARLPAMRAMGGIDAALLARFEEGLAIPGSVYVQILDERAIRLRRFLEAVMKDIDVLHAPVCRVLTPDIATIAAGGSDAARYRAELTVLNRPFNYLGLPSLSLPCGFTETETVRMPLGFQLVGKPFADARLLAIGAAWQRQTDWHRAAPALRWPLSQ